MKELIGYIFIIIIICVSSYYAWALGRKINYSLQYENMVVETIRNSVKSECLK